MTDATIYPSICCMDTMNSLDCLDCGGAGHDDLEGTVCESCRGTGGVPCNGCDGLATGIDRSVPTDHVALCSDCQAVPVEVIEDQTTPVPNLSMYSMVYGGAR